MIKFVKDKNRIASSADSEFKRQLKIRPAQKYKGLYVELLKLFKKAQEKGNRAGFG